MKFYQRPEFLSLNKKWNQKLANSGFDDIEDKNENLKNPNIRTQSWDNRDQILEFYLALDEFLNLNEIPGKHRKVLEMYSQGIYLKEISVKVSMSYAWVRLIVEKYKYQVLQQ